MVLGRQRSRVRPRRAAGWVLVIGVVMWAAVGGTAAQGAHCDKQFIAE